MDNSTTVIGVWTSNVTDGEMISLSPIPTKHGLQLHPELYKAMGYTLLTCGVLGILANGLIIVLIRLNKYLRGPFHQLLESLSWTQFLLSLLGNPMSATSALSMQWKFGEAGCKYYGFVMTVLGLFSINILTLISFERYICIVKPQMNHILTKRTVSAGLAIALGIAIAWGVFPLAGWSEYKLDGPGIGCCPTLSENATSYTACLVVFQAVLPLIAIIFCYVNIFMVVRQSRQNITQHNSTSQSSRDRQKRERKVAFILATAVVSFVLSWAPYCIASLVHIVDSSIAPPEANAVAAFIAKCSTIWNPIIYMASHSQYQRAFLKLIHCVRSGDRSGLTTTVDSEMSEGSRIKNTGISVAAENNANGSNGQKAGTSSAIANVES